MGSDPRDAAIDRHALNAPSSAATSLERLAAYLPGELERERDRAHVIFRWVTHNVAYDSAPLATRAYGDLSAPGAQPR